MDVHKKKLLLIGGWERIMDNLIGQETHFEMQKCPLLQTEFTRNMRYSMPHAIVICLSDDPHEISRVQIAVEDDLRRSDVPVFVIGNAEACLQLKFRLNLPNIDIFARPVDIELFFVTIDQRIDQAAEVRERLRQAEEARKAAEQAAAQATAQAADKTASTHAPAAQAAAPLPKKEEGARKSILVVDDDVRMLNVIKLYLQELYDVTVVPNGKLAIKFLLKKPADLVLLDYLMPGLDGPDVLREIRESCPNPDVPVLFLTGVSDREQVLRGLEYHPNGYLLKPVTRQVLLDRVTEILLDI